MLLSALFGLCAALSWGTGDYLAKVCAERYGFWSTLLGMNIASGLLLSAVLPAEGHAPLSAHAWWVLCILAVLNTAGGLLLYYAFAHGQLAIVSPVAATYPAFSALLAYALIGQRLGAGVIIAVAAVISGTMLVTRGSRSETAQTPPRAIGAAALAAAAFAYLFFALGTSVGTTSLLAPVWLFRVVGTALLCLPLVAGRPPRFTALRDRRIWLMGAFDSAGYAFYAAGARHGPIAVVSSLGGLFSVWTVFLAIRFLRERLSRQQWAGVALILAAVVVIGSR